SEILDPEQRDGAKNGDRDKQRDEEASTDTGDVEATESYRSRTIAAFTTSAMLPRLSDLHDQTRCLIFLATNHIDKIDTAITREGRFDFTLTINHPTIDRLIEYVGEPLSEKTLKFCRLESLEDTAISRVVAIVKTALEKLPSEKRQKRLK